MNSRDLLKAWTEAASLQREGALIDLSLRVRTHMQQELLRSVYDGIAGLGPVLQRWERNGSDTLGMAAVAAAWNRRPSTFDGDRGIQGRPTHESPERAEFKNELGASALSLNNDALYLLMQCQVPQGADTQAHLTLKAWVLLAGIELALGGVTADRYLATACNALRRAAYELPHQPWRQILEPLGPWTPRREDLTEHIKAYTAPSVRDESATPKTGGERAKTDGTADAYSRAARQIVQFAQGRRHKLEEAAASRFDVSSEVQSIIERTSGAWTAPGDDLDDTQRDQSTATAAPPTMHGAIEDEQETIVVEVDPDASPFIQSLHVRSAQLNLGAAARFLPWDWQKFTPPERRGFERLIDETLAAPPDERVRLLAALAWIARETGLGLEDCLQVPIAPLEPQLADAQWCIDLSAGVLRRIPPRRANHRRLTDEQRRYVRLSASHIQFPPTAAVLEAMRAAQQRRPGARLIGQLWSDPSQGAPTAFRRWVATTPATRRLQPAMLSRELGQRAYELTKDAVLARLLPSTPNSALPASTAYAAFDDSSLHSTWPNVAALPTSACGLNVAGSLLDITNDSYLAGGFRNAREQIRERGEEGDWIAFHNTVALYWDAALRAATGVRPVNDLWLSDRDFDWDLQFVFVDDKASPVAESGRLIPLPPSLCQAFADEYLNVHRPWIIERLTSAHASTTLELPMLFVIETDRDGRRIAPISSKDRSMLGIEDPLPRNVFRHRLRTRLHTQDGVDKEVIDSLMGHGDGATLTHGDYSMRIWRDDAAAIRPALVSIYEALNIQAPPRFSVFAALARTAESSRPPFRLRAAPAPARHGRTLHIAAEALRTIRRYVHSLDDTGDFPSEEPATGNAAREKPSVALLHRLAKLSSDELESLSRQLLAQKDGLPDTTGVLRYEYLLRLGEALWVKEGMRLSVKRRYAVREVEDTPFRREAAGAAALVERLRSSLDALFEAAPPRSRIPLGHAFALLLFDLCLTSRLTHPQVLDSLLEDKDAWRVVRLHGRCYLEWSPESDLTVERNAACMRFPISLRSAWLLTEVIRFKRGRRRAWAAEIPSIRAVAALLASHEGSDASAPSIEGGALLEKIRIVVGQTNAIELPGTVAGYLAGRILTASLGWAEWLQVKEGRWTDTSALPLTIPAISIAPLPLTADGADKPARARFAVLGEELEADDESVTPIRATSNVRGDSLRRPPNERSRISLDLVNHIQREIRKLQETKGLSARRKRKAEELSGTLRARASEVSGAIRLLCLWAMDLLLRPGRRKLATSSVARYFSALSPRFLAIGCDVDLERMDDDEIEEFYAEVMEITTVKKPKDVYVGLRNFHRFAHRTAGLPDIDWSEIAVPGQLALGAPGYLDEASYMRLLERLGLEPEGAAARPWQLQSFAVLAYRFGLRGGEIGGLLRSDVVWGPNRIHVLVRPNRLRGLKRPSSRRVVPQLFELSSIETAALQLLRDEHTPIAGIDQSNAPLFTADAGTDGRLDDLTVRRHLNTMLKEMTGQAGTSLHDLRHSFAANVWATTQAFSWPVLGTTAAQHDREDLVATLLGPNSTSVSRRSPWALARLLGHAHPGMHLRFYVHCLSDTLDWLIDTQVSPPRGVTADALRCPCLDAAPVFEPRLLGTSRQMTGTADPAAGLIALRYIAAGRSDEQTAQYTRLPLSDVRDLRQTSTVLFERLSSSKRSGLAKHLEERPLSIRLSPGGLLAFLHASSFERLHEGLEEFDSTQLSELASMQRIDADEWSAMVGPRREISLWRPDHFALFALLVRKLTSTNRNIRLGAPKLEPSDTCSLDGGALARMARDNGWLPSADPHQRTESESLCSTIDKISDLPAVRLSASGMRVDRRAVLLFTGAAEDIVRDRIELVVCAVCMNLFMKRATSTHTPLA